MPISDIQPYTGGLAFDALATEVESSFLTFQDPGWPVGAIASVIGLGQALGDAMLVTPPGEEQVEVGAAAAVEEAAAAPVQAPTAVTDVADETPATGLSAVGRPKSSGDNGRPSSERVTSRGESDSRAARNAD